MSAPVEITTSVESKEVTVPVPVPAQAPVQAPALAETPVEAEVAVQEEEEPKAPKPVLTPAPIPKSSPWKAVPVAATGSRSGKWPSAQEAVGKIGSQRAAAPTIKATGKEKWLPIKASIVVSGSKKPNGANANSAGKKQSPKKNKRNGKQKQQQNDTKADLKKDSASAAVSIPALAKEAELESAEQEPREQDSQPQQRNHAPRRPNSNGQYRRHTGNPAQSKSGSFQRRRFHNNGNGNGTDSANGNGNVNSTFRPPHFAPFQQRAGFTPFQNRQPRHFNQNYRPRTYQRHHLSTVPFYPSPPPYPFIAVTNIARQIEYYFSIENLAKDTYLRSKFTSEGYVPLSAISKFYRIVNMSLGGDESLILGALREIVANEQATVDVALGPVASVEEENRDDEQAQDSPEDQKAGKEGGEEKEGEKKQAHETQQEESVLDRYYIRAKEWEQWVLEDAQPVEIVVEKILLGSDLDEHKVEPPVFEPQTEQKQNPVSESA